jgi:hypothetical protein
MSVTEEQMSVTEEEAFGQKGDEPRYEVRIYRCVAAHADIAVAVRERNASGRSRPLARRPTFGT